MLYKFVKSGSPAAVPWLICKMNGSGIEQVHICHLFVKQLPFLLLAIQALFVLEQCVRRLQCRLGVCRRDQRRASSNWHFTMLMLPAVLSPKGCPC